MNDAVTDVTTEEVQDTTEVQTEETPSMEELLKEFDNGTEETGEQEQDQVTENASSDPRIDQLTEFMQSEQARRTNTDIDNAISLMKEEEALKELPDRMLKGYINELARENQDLVRAFAQRHEKPEAWAKVVRAAAGELGKQLGTREEKVTSDMASIRSAVEQSETKSNDGPTDEDILKMSDADFRDYKQKLGLNTAVWG